MSDVPSAQGAPSAVQAKRTRPRKSVQPTSSQLDGTVSDTVTSASPRSPKPPRQPRQSAAPRPVSAQTRTAAERARPASVGGSATQVMNTPAKEQAYAGSRFQASPAASKLPIPHKFFSRSVPDVAEQESLAKVLDGETTPEVMSSPEQDVASPSKHAADLPQVKSPLAMFFDADKAERYRRASSTLSPSTIKTILSPIAKEDSMQNGMLMTGPNQPSQPNPGTLAAPQRPQAGERTKSSPGAYTSQQGSGEDLSMTTEVLKAMLFKNIAQSPAPQQTPLVSPQQTPHRQVHQSPQWSTQQTPQSHSQSTPWTSPTPASTPQTDHRQSNGLHYGNANLSPMFAAVRNEAPMHSPLPPSQPWNSAPSPQHAHGQHPPQSPSSFSRQYLDQHIRASMPAIPPSQLIGQRQHARPDGPQSRPQSNGGPPLQAQMNGWQASQHESYGNGNSQPTAQTNGLQGVSPAPRQVYGQPAHVVRGVAAGTPRDVQEMSDDLRRMLNMVR
ncbi:hypothetical protein LTR95_007041 [Oleoguttula sp. CCFEE 5521]